MTTQTLTPENSARWIENEIKDFCRNSPDNSLRNGKKEPITDNILVGFSNGADPLYAFLQKDIGQILPLSESTRARKPSSAKLLSVFRRLSSLLWWRQRTAQMTPIQIFKKTFPNKRFTPQELTVISYILPLTQLAKEDNRKETTYPSERWAWSKHFGDEFDKKLAEHLIETLNAAGYEAVAPIYSPLYSIGMSKKYFLASTWSHRHAAYVSGLGTFGLCDGLITEHGKAIRCGSIIARIHIPPTPRPYTNHRAYCLYYASGTCGACIKRCPAGAISANGHDKVRCYRHCFGNARQYMKSQFGIDDYACGLCQTGVPCESQNPTHGISSKTSTEN